MGPQGTAIAQTAIQSGGGLLGSLASGWFNARQARKNRQWNTDQYNNMRQDAIMDSNVQWDRQNDWKTKMDSMRNAGVNPYAALGSSIETPTTRGTSLPNNDAYPQNQMDFSQMANIFSNVIDTKLKLAQINNLNQDSKIKGQDAIKKTKENSYYDKLSTEQINILEATHSNLIQQNENLRQQYESEGFNTRIKKWELSIKDMEEEFTRQKLKLANNLTQEQINETVKRIEEIGERIKNIKEDTKLKQRDSRRVSKNFDDPEYWEKPVKKLINFFTK